MINFKNPSVSIIVPARNEAGTIKKIIDELPQLGDITEVIFIEGHSQDNTWSEIKENARNYHGPKILKYAKQEGEGKGDAVRTGFEMAKGKILIIYDADMSVPADEAGLFYRAMVHNEAVFVNGSRFIFPMEKRAMRSLNYIANRLFAYVFKWLFKQSITDTLCGTKALWKKDYERIKKERAYFGDFDPFGDFDLLFGAARSGLKIVEIPVHYKERIYGSTNIRRWKHGWLLIKMALFAIRKMKFRGLFS